MMRYYSDGFGYGYGDMMGGGLVGSLICAVVLIDLILLGVLLWRKISSKDCRDCKDCKNHNNHNNQ